ncbi:MAG: Mth938-like domain-containing protein [Rhizobiaceae bacterium]|nr:Mth938-like domain-containing protein [Rhizobiaceae bacterium]
MREAHFPGRAPIDAYGNGGFRFAEMSHRGSILCLPSGIHGWPVADPAALTAEDFAKAVAEASGIDVLLVGMGLEPRPMPRAIREALKGAGLGVDIMTTGAAVRTYNVLIAEDRNVAAALIAV